MPIDNVTTGTTIDAAWGNDVADTVNALEAAVAGSALPAGAILPYGGSTAPTGFLLCDGSSVLRATYAALFTAIGTTFGSVDGTHFTLPDLRGRFALGKAAAGTGSTLGASGGALGHTHTGASHLHTGPSHQHTASAHTHTGAGHTHTGPSHQHESPFISGPTTSMRKIAAATFGTGSTQAATQVYSGSSDSSSAAVLLVSADGTGNTGSTTPAAGGSTTPADTGAAGTSNTGSTASGASSAADAPFLAVQYVIKA